MCLWGEGLRARGTCVCGGGRVSELEVRVSVWERGLRARGTCVCGGRVSELEVRVSVGGGGSQS